MSALFIGYPLETIGILGLTAFVAGMARGFSGFGAALIFVPLAARFIGPQAAAPLLLLTDGFMTAPLIWSSWHFAHRRAVAVMAVGGFIGVPLGTVFLALGDPLVLRWGIVGLVAAMLALLASGWRYHGNPRDAATVGTGVVSGVFSGIAQIGGPPVVAYWLGGATDATRMRASTILYFAISTIFSGVAYLVGGLLKLDILLLACLMAPSFGAGLWTGTSLFGTARPETFRAVCLGLIALSLFVSLPVWG